jgi:hypothetical protein
MIDQGSTRNVRKRTFRAPALADFKCNVNFADVPNSHLSLSNSREAKATANTADVSKMTNAPAALA